METMRLWLTFYSQTQVVQSFCLDHSQQLRKAFGTIFPEANPTECYFHVMSNVEKWKYKMNGTKEIMKKHMSLMYKATSLRIFIILGRLTSNMLLSRNEIGVDNTLLKTYLHEDWCCFWHCASGMPGVVCNQNLLASFHHQIKSAGRIHKTLPFRIFINKV